MAEYRREDLARTIDRLRGKIKRFREAGVPIGEENTKVTLIEPMLAALGWDIEEPDEVHREYRKKPQDAPVDYALCMLRAPRLFLEAKSLDKNIDDRRWASQVLSYATVVGIEWCVLTNGDEYRLYNAHAEVDVEEKLFRRVAISDKASQRLLEDTLDLLSQPRFREKRLTLLWEAHHIDRQVQSVMELLRGKPEPGFVRLIRRHAKGLGAKEVQASLQRCRIRVDFPVESLEPLPQVKKSRRTTRKEGRDRLAQVKGLPTQAQLEVPLLQQVIRLGGSLDTRNDLDRVAATLAEAFSVAEKARLAKTRDGRTTVWKNRLQWVRNGLTNTGDLDGSQRGVWQITPKGRARVQKGRQGAMKLVDPGQAG